MNRGIHHRGGRIIIDQIESVHGRLFFLIGLIISLILAYTIQFVDDTPYYEMIDEKREEKLVFSTASPLVEISTDGFVFSEGEGLKLVESPLCINEGDVVRVTFKGHNNAEIPMQVSVDLYNDNYDLSGMEDLFLMEPGETEFSTILPFHKTNHPKDCFFRFFSSENGNVEFYDISVDVMRLAVNDHPLIKRLSLMMSILAIVFALLFTLSCMFMLYSLRIKKVQGSMNDRHAREKRKTLISEVLMYIAVVGIVTVSLLILYRDINIYLPLDTNGDAMGVLYYGRLIDEFGPSLVGHRSGGGYGSNMYDYPYSDFFSFVVVKLIGVFTDNPYLIINCFYFLCYYLAAFVSTASLRYLKLDRCAAAVLSVLFAFSPYIQMKYEHMWLVPYFMVPVACVVALSIIKDEIGSIESEELREKKYCRNLFLCFVCAFEGVYYACFTCILLCISAIILIMNTNSKTLKHRLYPIGYIASVILGVATNVVPNVLYWIINGINTNGDIQLRSAAAVEWNGLKLTNLIMPVSHHRISALSGYTDKYIKESPIGNSIDSSAASLGIIGTIGLIVALLYLFKRNTDKSISYILVAILLIAQIGGVSQIFANMGLYHVRVYSRMCVYILWLSLLQVGCSVSLLCKKIRGGWKYLLFTGFLIIGLYDQTWDPGSNKNDEYTERAKIISDIEASLPDGSYVFQLPYTSWPSAGVYDLFMPYIESENICWSYGAMEGREESEWQRRITQSSEMPSLIQQIKDSGYDGICLDTKAYDIARASELGSLASTPYKDVGDYISEIEGVLGKPSIKDKTGSIYYWAL